MSLRDLFGVRSLRADLRATRVELESLRAAYRRAYRQGVKVGQIRHGRDIAAARSDRLTADWPIMPVSADAIVRASQRQMRARARQLYVEDDTGRRFVQMLDANVVGHRGIQFQARVRDVNGEQDALANAAIEFAWRDWCERKLCDTRGRLTFTALCRQAIRGAGVDGEILALIDLGDGVGGPYRFSLRLLDPELLDLNRQEDLPNGRSIRMGIEYDPIGRTIAYHLRDVYGLVEGQKTYEQPRRIPADRIVYHYVPELVGQSRGLPWMCAAMTRMKMLGGYEDAALVAARVGAAKVAMIESADGEQDADEVDAEGNKIIDLEPGTTEYLDPGEKLVGWTPDYPRGEFKDFDKAILRRIASGLGVSYVSLANDLEGVNYSSIRQGVLEEREAWKAIQEWFVEGFCFEVYRRWLYWQLYWGQTLLVPTAAGPRPLDAAKQAKYERVSWQPRRWSWVDPRNDHESNRVAIGMRTTSISRIIREQGDEPDEVWQELASDIERLAELGIAPDSAIMDAVPQPIQMGEPVIKLVQEEIDVGA